MELYFDRERFVTDKQPWHGELQETADRNFNFVVVGDRTGFALKGVFEKALDAVKELKPDFVLSVGDLIEGYWEKEAEAHGEWEEIEAHILKLGLPFFLAIGNHDCGSSLMENVWRARYGSEYYAFRYKNSLFVIMNTEDPPIPIPDSYIPVLRTLEQQVKTDPVEGEKELQAFFARLTDSPESESDSASLVSCLGESQMEFVSRVLEEQHDVDWTYVVMHRPLWKTGDSNYARLEQLLQARKHTVFAGHLHQLEMSERDGNALIQMGRTGACKHRDWLSDGHHILWVSVLDGKPTYEIIEVQAE
jgi:hypothetical protein